MAQITLSILDDSARQPNNSFKSISDPSIIFLATLLIDDLKFEISYFIFILFFGGNFKTI